MKKILNYMKIKKFNNFDSVNESVTVEKDMAKLKDLAAKFDSSDEMDDADYDKMIKIIKDYGAIDKKRIEDQINNGVTGMDYHNSIIDNEILNKRLNKMRAERLSKGELY